MKLILPPLLAIVIALSIISCSKEIQDPVSDATSELAVVSLPGIDIGAATSLLPVQTSVFRALNANVRGFLQALPGDYSTTSNKYPLIIYLHGIGELGNGGSNLNKVSVNSIPNLIKNKKFPASFTVRGKKYSFIVLSPQFKKKPKAVDVDDIIDYAIKNYRVDASRIYICGISMGGGAVWNAGGLYTSKVAAIVPMCGANAVNFPQAKNIAALNLPVWAFHNSKDPKVNINYTNGWVKRINKMRPSLAPRKTIFNSASHNCWTKASDPNYKETINGKPMNIYEWMLLYKR